MKVPLLVLATIIVLGFCGFLQYKAFTRIEELVRKPHCDTMREFLLHSIDRLKAYFDDRFNELEEIWKQKKLGKR